MGVIDLSSFKPIPDTSGDANQIANGFTALETLLNGNLDAQNIAASAIGARTSSTVGGLGTGTAGSIGQVRCGSSPYDFVPVIYDASYAKWVGPEFLIEDGFSLNGTASGSGSFADSLPASQLGAAGETNLVRDYTAKTTAGLVLQISGRYTALDVSGTGRGTVGVGVQLNANPRSAWTTYDGPAGLQQAITSNGQTADFEFDWTDVNTTNFPSLTAAKWLRVILRAKHTVSNVRGQNAIIYGRWVG